MDRESLKRDTRNCCLVYPQSEQEIAHRQEFGERQKIVLPSTDHHDFQKNPF